MSTFPASLPQPVAKRSTPKARVLVANLPGAEAYVNQERDYSGAMQLEFFFTAEQTETFYGWWKDALLKGGKFFNAFWPSLRPGPLVCQFLSEPVFRHVYQGAYRVTAEVSVRGATEAIPGDPAQFLGFTKNVVTSAGYAPPEHQEGDLLVRFLRREGGGGIGLPSGWTELVFAGNGSYLPYFRLAYKVATSTLDTFFDGVPTTTQWCAAWRGGLPGSFALSPEGLGSSATIPSVPITSPASLVICGINSNQSYPGTTPSGLILLGDSQVPSITSFYSVLSTPGAVAAFPGAVTSWTGGNAYYYTWALELVPS